MLASLIRLGATLAIPLAVAGTAAAQYETDPQPAGLMLFTGEDFRGEVREVFEPVSSIATSRGAVCSFAAMCRIWAGMALMAS